MANNAIILLYVANTNFSYSSCLLACSNIETSINYRKLILRVKWYMYNSYTKGEL